MALRTGNASELPIIGRTQVCFLSRHEMLYGMFKVFIQHLFSKKFLLQQRFSGRYVGFYCFQLGIIFSFSHSTLN